jgi:hypothetical protein
MPSYGYCCDACGRYEKREYDAGAAPTTTKCRACGKKASRDYRGFMARKSADPWHDHYSDAAAVHPEQIPEMQAHLKRATGKYYEFDHDGRPRFDSRASRSAYLRANGMFDRDAGYSDPC